MKKMKKWKKNEKKKKKKKKGRKKGKKRKKEKKGKKEKWKNEKKKRKKKKRMKKTEGNPSLQSAFAGFTVMIIPPQPSSHAFPGGYGGTENSEVLKISTTKKCSLVINLLLFFFGTTCKFSVIENEGQATVFRDHRHCGNSVGEGSNVTSPKRAGPTPSGDRR